MIKYDSATRAELNRLTVPVTYEGKETYMTRLEGDPELTKGVQIILPAMTYEMMSLYRAPDRMQSSFITNQFSQEGLAAKKVHLAIPYNMLIDLNLYVRNMEDGLQIIEQILPFFAPDYTVRLKYLSGSGTPISYDLPITLENINFSNSYEGPGGSVRSITWTLNFAAKMFIFGPMPDSAIIKDSIINIRDYDTENLIFTTIESVVEPLSANVTDSYNVNTTITRNGA